jgi:transcriptional regulator with XRE-family HTH domain
MNYSQTLLTSLKSTCGGVSDYKAAQLLGCSKQYISDVVNGRKNLSPEMALKAADLAKMDKEIVLIRMLIDSAKSDEMIKILEGMEKRIKH